MVCGSYKKMYNIIFLAGAAAFRTTATAALLAVFGGRRTLYITQMRNSYHHIFFFNQVKHIHLVTYINDLRFALITKLCFYFR